MFSSILDVSPVPTGKALFSFDYHTTAETANLTSCEEKDGFFIGE